MVLIQGLYENCDAWWYTEFEIIANQAELKFADFHAQFQQRQRYFPISGPDDHVFVVSGPLVSQSRTFFTNFVKSGGDDTLFWSDLVHNFLTVSVTNPPK